MKRWLPILLLLASIVPSAAVASPAGRARTLFASAQRRLAVGTSEQRQVARAELEEAAKLDRENREIALALGNLYLQGDMLARARDVAERLVALDPDNAAARLLQGSVCRRYWLTEADEESRDKAIVFFARGTRLAPDDHRCWAALVPLLVDADELDQAKLAAALALRHAPAPARPEAMLLVAGTAQRTGDIATADRLFRAAIPRLPARLRDRFEDLAPLLPPWNVERYLGMDAPARERFEERFWLTADPDPVSIENEARLEFWARVTQATLLYGTSRPGEWDMRAQYYVRFGRPAWAELNPVGRGRHPSRGDWLAWTYPELGLRVWMGTPSAFTGYSERISAWSVWAQPSPDSLASRTDLDAVERGWAVFHRLPAGVEPLGVSLAIAHFESDEGPRLLVQAEALGSPADRITAEWTVLDSTFAPVLREDAAMAASACRPEEARASGFTASLAPGRYRIGMQIADESGRLGVVKRDVVVPASPGGLALSDLVVTCGPPQLSIVAGSGVRLEPETGLFPAADDHLNAYFEIYRLSPAEDGEAQFDYECVVRSAARDSRGWLSRLLSPRQMPEPIQVSRRETTLGSLRRQFLTVPVGALPAGAYEIEVRVRDVRSGAESTCAARFVRGD